MASISVRKENESRLAQQPTTTWEPGRMLRNILHWDPFQEMGSFPSMGLMDARMTEFSPSFEVRETKDSYVFRADVPGVKESDLDVTVAGNRLTVSGKREAETRDQSDTYYLYERSYGNFCRTFTLPEGADATATHADLKDGVLSLTVSKRPEIQPKKISIKSQAAKS